jgi:alpha-glucosidase
MKFKILLLALGWFPFSLSFAQNVKTYQVTSPDKHIQLKISVGEDISWSVNHNETSVIVPSSVSMTLASGEILGRNAKIISSVTTTEDRSINTPVYKKERVRDHYNQLSLTLKGGYGLVFRAYDDGVAYRFLTQKKDSITITDEQANFNFKEDEQG